MDESERYLWHFDVFLVLSILTLLGGFSMIPEVYWGVEGYPSSQMQGILHIISNYVQNTFFQILALLFINLTILLCRIVYLL